MAHGWVDDVCTYGWMNDEWMGSGNGWWIDDGWWIDGLWMDGVWMDGVWMDVGQWIGWWWMDCGEMDRWVDGWMDHGKKEENLREKPLSLYSPQPSSLINSQSRRGTAVPSTMCCGNADAKPVLGQPLIVSRLVPAASVFNWFPQLHSCPFLSPHPAAVSLPSPSLSLASVSIASPSAFWTWEKGIHAPPLQLLLTLWSHLATHIPIPDTRNDRCRRQVTILSSYKMAPPHMQGCMLTVGELEMGINTSSVPLYH